MTHDEATKLRPGDTIVFVGRNPWASPVRGTVANVFVECVRVLWEDEWHGNYFFNGLGQMTKETTDDA